MNIGRQMEAGDLVMVYQEPTTCTAREGLAIIERVIPYGFAEYDAKQRRIFFAKVKFINDGVRAPKCQRFISEMVKTSAEMMTFDSFGIECRADKDEGKWRDVGSLPIWRVTGYAHLIGHSEIVNDLTRAESVRIFKSLMAIYRPDQQSELGESAT